MQLLQFQVQSSWPKWYPVMRGLVLVQVFEIRFWSSCVCSHVRYVSSNILWLDHRLNEPHTYLMSLNRKVSRCDTMPACERCLWVTLYCLLLLKLPFSVRQERGLGFNCIRTQRVQRGEINHKAGLALTKKITKNQISTKYAQSPRCNSRAPCLSRGRNLQHAYAGAESPDKCHAGVPPSPDSAFTTHSPTPTASQRTPHCRSI